MTVIESFVQNYNKEYDLYQRLAITGKDLLEKDLYDRGIKAIVTNQTKKRNNGSLSVVHACPKQLQKPGLIDGGIG